jgi:hypothetical protein
MATKEEFIAALAPLLDVIATLDLTKPEDARATLDARFPLDGDVVKNVRALMREGVKAGWLCDKENAGVKFSRVKKSTGTDLSVDAVHMNAPGPGHTHPNGEVDLCFDVEGSPKFDGHAPGWTVYGPMSWHVPSVTGGVMDILYFLPSGAIRFEPKPA